MVKVILKIFVIFVFIFLLINFVSATFSFGKVNHSISKAYGSGNEISGWINISLSGEPANSIFTGSISDEKYTINLINLIKKTSNFIYNCNTFNCSSDYSSSNSESSKSFILNKGESKVIGLKISENEDVNSFSDFSLTAISSSSENSEINPLVIDVLNDYHDEWRAHTPSEVFSTANYGCYSDDYVVRVANIPTDYWYCERIKLFTSPSVKIGAVIKGGISNSEFTMSIEDLDGNFETCLATSETGTGTISCTPNFAVQTKGNYFVCIQAEEPGSQINFINTNPYTCGFSGTLEEGYTSDFEIFAQTNKYAPTGTFTLNNEESELSTGEARNIEGEIEDFISERYDNDCSKDCIIPIKVTSGVNQEITLSGAHLSYHAGGILLPGDMDLYDLSETPAKITANAQRLYLDGGKFYTPNEYSNYTFSLSLGENGIFSEMIAVGKGPLIRYLTPTSTAANYPTEFKVSLNGSYDIQEYTWDFGDGSRKNTTTNRVTYTYSAEGVYELKVIVTDTNGRSSSKKIDVAVKSASEMVPSIFSELKSDAAAIKTQITSSNFSEFEERSITSSLSLDLIDSAIINLEAAISMAGTEEEFIAILGQIVELKIPSSLQKTVSGQNTIFYSDMENINMEIIKEIGGGDYSQDSEEDYKNAVLAWEVENVGTGITFSEISADYGEYNIPFLKTFEMNIDGGGNDFYLVIKEMENLLFGGNYSEQKVDGYVYIKIENPRTILFSTTEENVDFTNLPVFIAPKISELTVIEGETLTEFKSGNMLSKNPGLFAIIVIIVILGALMIWVLMQIWYVKKYENYLFKNRNNLYNLINYINSAKKTGMSDKDITAKLKKAGWNSEQLQYALKKYAGKKTWFQRTFVDKKKVPATSNAPNKNIPVKKN